MAYDSPLSTPLLASDSMNSDSKNESNNDGADDIASPSTVRNELSSSTFGALMNNRIGSRAITWVTIPFLIVLHFLSLMLEFFTQRRLLSPGYYTQNTGIGKEEQEIVNEGVPNIQRRLRKDLNKTSAEQKVVSDQINDLKERVAKIERGRELRALRMKAQSSEGGETTKRWNAETLKRWPCFSKMYVVWHEREVL